MTAMLQSGPHNCFVMSTDGFSLSTICGGLGNSELDEFFERICRSGGVGRRGDSFDGLSRDDYVWDGQKESIDRRVK